MKKNKMLLAFMEEYRRAVIDYKAILNIISLEDFIKIRDDKTEDLDCKSIETVTFHVIQSGYIYASYIQSVSNDVWVNYNKEINATDIAVVEIEKMLDYAEQSFYDNWFKTNEELKQFSFETRWNVTYDLEQLLEHAIVHVLRHRRQIENFLKNN